MCVYSYCPSCDFSSVSVLTIPFSGLFTQTSDTRHPCIRLGDAAGVACTCRMTAGSGCKTDNPAADLQGSVDRLPGWEAGPLRIDPAGVWPQSKPVYRGAGVR